jgi:hypothetical protein
VDKEEFSGRKSQAREGVSQVGHIKAWIREVVSSWLSG